jgi:hypothetical protein
VQVYARDGDPWVTQWVLDFLDPSYGVGWVRVGSGSWVGPAQPTYDSCTFFKLSHQVRDIRPNKQKEETQVHGAS